MTRPSPTEVILGALPPDTLPALREALARDGLDPRDRDAFLMCREAIELVRTLRPEQGLGEAMDQLVAFVHHAYLQWAAGGTVVAVDPPALAALLGPGAPAAGHPPAPCYVQVPERRVWAGVQGDAPHEPLDGIYLHGDPAGALRVLGVFGMHPERDGFTVVEASGPRPGGLRRADGTAPFAPAIPGGDRAGLHSLVGTDELLELGWRAAALVPERNG